MFYKDKKLVSFKTFTKLSGIKKDKVSKVWPSGPVRLTWGYKILELRFGQLGI